MRRRGRATAILAGILAGAPRWKVAVDVSIITRNLQRGRRSCKAASAVLLTTLLATMTAGIAAAATPAPYTNGFEFGTAGWEPQIVRVASGMRGIASSTGSWHAETPKEGAPSPGGAALPANSRRVGIRR